MTLQIIKYQNRKLYDRSQASYISMKKLIEIVTSRTRDVEIVCDRTGRDLTLETLARALYEVLKAKTTESPKPPFPSADLVDLIRKAVKR